MTLDDIRIIANRTKANDNMRAFLDGVTNYGKRIDWQKRIVQVHGMAQVCEESGGFQYDREIWGPTAAQKEYEDRADLGHSSAVPNEAYLFRGKGPLQITGRYNHRKFTQWVRHVIDPTAPDFEANPDLMLTDPWEGLTFIWYWESHELTRYAEVNQFENITREINGGFNGYADRMMYFGRAALYLLGRKPNSLREYQAEKGLKVDNVCGPNTRKALFLELQELPDDIPIPETPTEPNAAEEKLAKIKPLLDQIETILGE